MLDILKKSLGTGGLKVVQAVMGVLVTIVLARLLGLAEFGLFSFGLAMATALAIPTKNGITELVVREVSRAEDEDDSAKLHGIMRWVLMFSCIYCLVVGGAVAAVSVALFPTSGLALSVALSMLIVPGLSLMGNFSGGLRGLGKPALALFPDTLLRPILLIAIALVLAAIRPDLLTATTATLAMTVATLIAALVNMWSFKRSIPATLQQSGAPKMEHRAWVRAALPFTAIGGAQIATRQADLILLGLLVDETSVGLYRIALQGAMLVAFGSQAVNMVLAPRLALLKNGHDTMALSRLLRLSILLSLCVAVPGFLLYVTAGELILTTLFGTPAAAALVPLIVLSAGNTVAMLNGAVIPLLNMTGNESRTLLSFALALVSTIILNLMLIPIFGTIGAATAAFLAIVISNLALRKAAITSMGIDPPATLFRKGYLNNDAP
ncbi:oligosaccharide flippase family protein [Loktanella sp. F6476L]|uniref:oligosaccharide flippase family protein n=1 Tax=Loktanella sp. F6476L TaxID=2926405 RepID=UPI001FF6E0D8|nr:oligosaccharide flippase family protein [Loktanella sp. F6476L]MCK0122418.1 oligosaccharide flippase family protein [Loktanella sp. F6476L]